MNDAALPQRPIWPGRNWWLALLVILILAGALRYPGYDFSLPYVTTGENHYMIDARLVIDFGTAKSLNMHHYPPGIIALNYMLLRFFQDENLPPTSLLGVGRLIAITTSIGTIIVLALLGYHAFGAPAGLIAAGLTAVTPIFVFHSRLQTADIYVAFFSILALWLSWVGTLYRRDTWSALATYALMLAIVFKYQAVLLTPFILFLPLVHGRSAWRQPLLGNLFRFALFSAWLIFLTPALEAFQNPQSTKLIDDSWVRHVQLNRLPGLSQFLAGFQTLLNNLDLFVLVLGVAGLSLLFFATLTQGSKKLKQHFALTYIAGSTFTWIIGVSFFDETNIRFYLVPAMLFWLLAGAGYATWFDFLSARWLSRINTLVPRSGQMLPFVAIFALVILNVPQLRTAIADTYDATLPDSRVNLMHYMDTTLASGRIMADQDNHRTLNREWGGYPGMTQFDYLRKDAGSPPLTSAPIDHWRAQDVLYAIMPYHDYQSLLLDDPAGYLNETTLLKSFPPSDAHRGPAMVVLRLHPMQHAATGQLGPIQLLGYDLSGEIFPAGETIPFHLYWQSRSPTDGPFIVFNHLLDVAGNTVAQIDGPPLPDPHQRRSTADWDDSEEIIISREFQLQLPETLAPGDYTLITGFYRRQDGARLISPVGENSLYVTNIQVTAAE